MNVVFHSFTILYLQIDKQGRKFQALKWSCTFSISKTFMCVNLFLLSLRRPVLFRLHFAQSWLSAIKRKNFFLSRKYTSPRVCVFLQWNKSIYNWVKTFKCGLSKFCGRQPLKSLKGYGLLKQTISLQVFLRLSSTKFT